MDLADIVFIAVIILAYHFAYSRFMSSSKLKQKYRLDAMRDEIINLKINEKVACTKEDLYKLLKPVDKVIKEFSE